MVPHGNSRVGVVMRFKEIMNSWAGLYDILDAFAAKGRLRRILGNHDLDPLRRDDYPYDLLHSLALEWKGNTLLAEENVHPNQILTIGSRESHGPWLDSSKLRYEA